MTCTVLTICGSLRKGSFNAALLRALPALAPEGMTLLPAPSFAAFPLYNYDVEAASGFPAEVTALAEAIRAADGVIIASPEYNFGVPGAFKNALDWVSRVKNQPFRDKPVALQSASPGPVGGARMQYHLRMSLIFLNALAFGTPEIFVGLAGSRFDADLNLTDEATKGFVRQQLAGFAGFIERTRPHPGS